MNKNMANDLSNFNIVFWYTLIKDLKFMFLAMDLPPKDELGSYDELPIHV
jgi:hypothetical protein